MKSSLPLLSADSAFQECLNVLGMENSSWDGTGFALVTDERGTLVGTIQDSDLRRWMQKHNRIPNSAAEFMNTDFFAVSEEELSDPEYVSQKKLELAKRRTKSRRGVRFVPLLHSGKPKTILSTHDATLLLGREKAEVVIVGLGYVGLTFAAVLAERGYQVQGVDTSEDVIVRLNSGGSHVEEEGLGDLLAKNVGRGLNFSGEIPQRNYLSPKTFVVCVGTPITSNGEPDMSFFEAAVSEIGNKLQPSDLVIIRSTVPLSTTQHAGELLGKISGLTPGNDFDVAFAPERTVEGEAIFELQALPQIVGADFATSLERACAFFHNVTKTVIPLGTSHSAELVKLAGNAYRDYVFAFGNRLNEICAYEGIDIEEVIDASNYQYPRSQIPKPSPGVGGPCLSKDSYILERYEHPDTPILSARRTNERAEVNGAETIASLMEEFDTKTLAVLGMAFKGVPQTNDLRNSPALEIGINLREQGFQVHGWDACYPEGGGIFAKIDSLYDSEVPIGIAILNNNPKNLDITLNLSFSGSTRFIYDPWKMLVGTNLKRILDLGIDVYGASKKLRRPTS